MTPPLRLVDPGVAEAREWAAWYRAMGYNPLPKRRDRNAPALSHYATERDSGIPDRVLRDWWSPGIQVATGVRWRLAVVDLDGPYAITRWARWARSNGVPPTWSVDSGGGGRHVWFRTPEGLDRLPSRLGSNPLWSLPGAEHSSVEVLGDRALAVCPPSVHPRTGRSYRWTPGSSPAEVASPATLPDWLLGLALREPRRFVPLPPERLRGARSRAPHHTSYRSRDVLDAIGDRKLDLASGWGLRPVARGPNCAGWVKCRAIDRDDANPSASFSFGAGTYIEPAVGMPSRLGFFELGVRLGAYADWRDACNDLGTRYGARPTALEPRHVG